MILGIGPIWSAGAGSLLIGLTAGYASTLLSATFAATVDASYLGRMGAITRLGDEVFFPLSMVAFGALASATALWVPFVVYGGAMVLLMTVPLRNPLFRTMALRD